MTFEKAIENLKKGKRIRRKVWHKLLITLEGEKLKAYYLDNNKWKPFTRKTPFFREDAILATDWEVVK